ncbi:hypothetical protein D5S17_17555 [Pseudonocardiaceae bacterium YIM PH 21723]|nr:hypothetical protein D5S17_17555 [Pseudonocardiaceae bacterium YIM PH 21723]
MTLWYVANLGDQAIHLGDSTGCDDLVCAACVPHLFRPLARLTGHPPRLDRVCPQCLNLPATAITHTRRPSELEQRQRVRDLVAIGRPLPGFEPVCRLVRVRPRRPQRRGVVPGPSTVVYPLNASLPGRFDAHAPVARRTPDLTLWMST